VKKIKIAPSILSADFTRLAEQIQMVEQQGADWIHLDVMDGHFVPNISFGPVVIRWIRKMTDLPLDAHLMITEPERYLADFQRVGVDILTVHQEACPHLHRTIQQIRKLGMKAGVSINPATPVQTLEEILPEVDLVLVMSVNPGFGGQEFIKSSLQKIRKMSQLIRSVDRPIYLQVDGGINAEIVPDVLASGADVLVIGSAIFAASDLCQAYQRITERVKKYQMV